MSDLISKRAVLEFIKEENKQDRPDDFKIHNIQRFIEDMKPVYPLVTAVKRLEEFQNEMPVSAKKYLNGAIEIVKEVSNG